MKMTNTENNARDAAWYDTRTAYMEEIGRAHV